MPAGAELANGRGSERMSDEAMSSDNIPVARSGDHVFIALDERGELYTTPRAARTSTFTTVSQLA
jgi:hypothetical protein